jgi:hypothetical protein
MKRTKHATAQEAWEDINEYLVTSESQVKKRGGIRTGNNVISYDHFMEINKLWVDPTFNFGNIFGYKIQKWSKLISNYIDFDFLDIAKSQVREKELKKAANYTIGFKFSNKHTSGHGCLLSLVFSRRYSHDNPVIIINIRSSEVTKRLLMDFLLVERIAEYVYGKNHSASVKIYIGQAYVTAENFVMYHNYKNLNELLMGHKGIMIDRVLALITKFINMDPETVKYRVHRRAVRRLNNVETPDLFAEDLLLYNRSSSKVKSIVG